MMSSNSAIDLLQTLTPEHQKQVIDFISSLKARESLNTSPTLESDDIWINDPFFGLWSDRSNMQDSGQWVRELRQNQWSRI